jgi:hypothetical protein
LVSLLVGFPILTAGADGGPSQTPSAADLRYLEPGFKALEVLEDLKVVHERRGADCMSAIGHEKFCSCLNNSLSLDLSFPEYVVLVTSLEGDTAALPLAPEKHRFRDEARHLRDVCVNKAFPGDRVDP